MSAPAKMSLRELLTDARSCGCRHMAIPNDLAISMTRLTDRQCEVLILLGTSMSNREIGRQLDISERTVKAHVNQILERLNLNTRLEAAVAAVLLHGEICLDRLESDDLVTHSGMPRQRRLD